MWFIPVCYFQNSMKQILAWLLGKYETNFEKIANRNRILKIWILMLFWTNQQCSNWELQQLTTNQILSIQRHDLEQIAFSNRAFRKKGRIGMELRLSWAKSEGRIGISELEAELSQVWRENRDFWIEILYVDRQQYVWMYLVHMYIHIEGVSKKSRMG